ncbi:hypothetical protein [Streptomyces chryseus]
MPSRRIELDELHGLVVWLRRHKGGRTYDGLAMACGYAASACTLRRAVDGRLPTWNAAKAFAYATGADQNEAERLWKAARDAAAAVQPAPARASRKPYTPGRISTLKGLGAAMRRVREEAGSPSLRALAREAGGDLPRSTLVLALRGERLPSARLLKAFLDACYASDRIAAELLAARDRIDPQNPVPAAEFTYPCQAAEEAEIRRQQTEEIRARCGLVHDEEAEDWYDQQLREEDEARQLPWGWELSNAELPAMGSEEAEESTTADQAAAQPTYYGR